MNLSNLLMASGGFWNVWPIIKIVALVVMAVCALFVILVVMFQPGNSSGVSALGGHFRIKTGGISRQIPLGLAVCKAFFKGVCV